jgi:hypothetical protein
MRAILEREAGLISLLLDAGSGDPELVGSWRQMHSQRHRRLTAVLEPILAGRSPAARRRAVDTAWALSSPEVYRLLVNEQGWTPSAFERWLADALTRELLGHPQG